VKPVRKPQSSSSRQWNCPLRNPSPAQFSAVPNHIHASRPAFPILDERELYLVICGDGIYDESGLIQRKKFGQIVPWDTSNQSDEMVAQFVSLVRDAQGWTDVNQSK